MANVLVALTLEVVKGNGLANLITESHEAGEFQGTLAAGMDLNKAVRVKKQIAALGARGDYLLITKHVTGTTVADANSLFIEGLDFTGVPTAVQHTVFGEFSPFVTPKSSMQESMLDGIDRQEVDFVSNVGIELTGSAKTAQNNKIRGVADARLTSYADEDALASVTEIYLKIKPNSDGVLIIPSGAKLWAIKM